MQLRTFVKISEVNNLSDARYCAGMGVNLLGFNIDPKHPEHIEAERYKEITDWVAGVKLVGEFTSSAADEVAEHLKSYPVDMIQSSNADNLAGFKQYGKPLIYKIDLSTFSSIEEIESLMQQAQPHVEFFLLEDPSEQIGLELEKQVLALTQKYPVVLGFAITEDNVNQLIEKYPLKGIALKGGDEIKPGVKDFDELAEILEQLDTDEFI